MTTCYPISDVKSTPCIRIDGTKLQYRAYEREKFILTHVWFTFGCLLKTRRDKIFFYIIYNSQLFQPNSLHPYLSLQQLSHNSNQILGNTKQALVLQTDLRRFQQILDKFLTNAA